MISSKTTIVFVGVFLVLAGCATQTSVTTINADQYDELSSQEDVVVIDVHIPEQEHLPNTDYIISYLDIDQIQQTVPNKNAPILVYCRSGSMSAQAAQDLVAAGYTKVYDLQGGRNAYVK